MKSITMPNDAWDVQECEIVSYQSYMIKTKANIQNFDISSSLITSIFFSILVAALGLFFCYVPVNSTYAQIEVTTDENISSPIFNNSISEDAEPKPDILYSALNSDEIVGEVLNNFTYPIENVRITASVYDKNGVIAATGDTYASEYVIKPSSKSGFDINLDEKLPNNSKYTLTTSFEQSDDVKPEALQLLVGRNYKDSNSFRLVGEVLNQGQDDAHSVKVSGIFYDKNHKVIDVDYIYTIPDTIGPNKKAPFEFSFYTDNPKQIESIGINVQSDEYSLLANNNLNETKS
jgi:hypothetical protein